MGLATVTWAIANLNYLPRILGEKLDAPGPLNLEKALRANDRLGGHLVSGHVDGMGSVVQFEPVGESWVLRLLAPVVAPDAAAAEARAPHRLYGMLPAAERCSAGRWSAQWTCVNVRPSPPIGSDNSKSPCRCDVLFRKRSNLVR